LIGRKARLHAAHGVTEYWIVEVAPQRIHRFRDPHSAEAAWASTETLEAPLRIAPAALPKLELSSDELWPPVAAG